MSTTETALDIPYARYDVSTAGYKPAYVADGSIRLISDLPEPARSIVAKAQHEGSAAYPLGYSVTVRGGRIVGGSGRI